MKSIFRTLTAFCGCLLFILCLSTPAKAAVETPTNLKQTSASASSVEVSWNTVLSSDKVIYDVQYATNVNGPWVFVDKEHNTMRTSPSRHISSLNKGQKYYVRVRASVVTGEYGSYSFEDGAWSNPIDVITQIDSGLKTTIKQTDCTSDSVTLEWDDIGATGYLVQCTSGGAVLASTETTETKATLSGLAANSQYYIKVIPVMKSSTYDATVTYNYTAKWVLTGTPTPTADLPYVWSNLGEVKLAPTNFKHIDGNGFEYEVTDISGKKITAGEVTSSSGVNVKSSKIKKYNILRYRVRTFVVLADNQRVYSKWSQYIMNCKQPEVKVRNSGSCYKLSWKKIKGATKYVVYGSTKQKSGYKKLATVKKANYTAKRLKNKAFKRGKTYYFYVVPYVKNGKKTVPVSEASYCWSLRKS